MSKPWLMGIDLGGSRVGCLLANSYTGATESSACAWRFNPAPGTFGTGFNLDLAALYAAVGRASRAALAAAGSDGSDVEALAISAMRFSNVILDTAGNALMAVPNTDARAADQNGLFIGAASDARCHGVRQVRVELCVHFRHVEESDLVLVRKVVGQNLGQTCTCAIACYCEFHGSLRSLDYGRTLGQDVEVAVHVPRGTADE